MSAPKCPVCGNAMTARSRRGPLGGLLLGLGLVAFGILSWIYWSATDGYSLVGPFSVGSGAIVLIMFALGPRARRCPRCQAEAIRRDTMPPHPPP